MSASILRAARLPSAARFSQPSFALSTLALGLLAPQAQALTESHDKLDQVVVTATRSPTKIEALAADVTVLDRSDIERQEGKSLVDLLASQAGIQFSSNGGLGKTGSLFIRGLEARHTLLLVDGVRVSSATLGTPSLDNLPLELVDRIEIVRGPMASLYGSSAMGGVIQVFTRRGRPGVHPNATVSLGSHGYGKLAAGAAFGQGNFDASAQVQRTVDSGFSATNEHAQFGNYNPDRDGFWQTSGSLTAGWQIHSDWRLDGLVMKSRGVTAYDDGPGVDARARLSDSIHSLRLKGTVLPGWETRIAASQSVDQYDTLSTASPYSSLGIISTNQRQVSWENSVSTPLGSALLLLEHLRQTVSRPGEAYAVSERSIRALGLSLSGSTGPLSWQVGIRTDDNSQFGKQQTGSAAWTYAFSPEWRASASYGTSFNAPSFNQLYYPGYGTPSLLPESGRHGELGLRWQRGAHSVKATRFDNRYRNFIVSGPLAGNVPQAQSVGVSASYEFNQDNFHLLVAVDRMNPHNATEGDKSNGNLLPRRAKNSLKLGADYDIANRFSLGTTLRASSRRFDDASNKRVLGGYAQVDMSGKWQLAKEWHVDVAVNNVANQRYETAYGFNQPGRELFISLRYQGQ